MRAKQVWSIESFLSVFLLNAVLVVALFFMARQVLLVLHQWVDPFLQADPTTLPEAARSAFENLNRFLNQVQYYLAPVVLGGGALITLILWLVQLLLGRSIVNHATREAQIQAPAAPKKAAPKPKETPEPSQFVQQSPQAAVQILSILQREGRFIDFLKEDLAAYEDSQIGAAVRSIHQGCRDALKEYVELKPVFEEQEGDEITVQKGFDAQAVRLTGTVSGDPPFKGILRHRGWRVVRVDLPQPTTEQKKDWILAPAEVELD